MSNPAAAEVVREFWRLMATNDFDAVAAVLAPEFVLEWPQSRERINPRTSIVSIPSRRVSS